ncbi:T9SS type A sorting domain-containing protein [Spirosoma oryzae]|nr:T9SS type A sorting domain-containing protein [Spirosoma oryzae]
MSVTAVCTGTIIKVPYEVVGSNGLGSGRYVVQLSDGGSYQNLVTYYVGFYKDGLGAFVPNNFAPGTYTVRVIDSQVQSVINASPTKLAIRSRPVAPTIAETLQFCPVVDGTNQPAGAVYIVPTPQREAGMVMRWQLSRRDAFGLRGEDYNQVSIAASKLEPGQSYTLTVSQGRPDNTCSGDTTLLTLTIRPFPSVAPPSLSLTVCQGDQGVDLAKKIPAPAGHQYQFFDGTGKPVTASIETSQLGTTSYTTKVMTTDGCYGVDMNAPGRPVPTGNVVVSVGNRPAKPVVSTVPIVLCQGQPAGPLSATTTMANTSLFWYGPAATGGVGSFTATVPATTAAGTGSYYVAQRLSECESERAAISVDVRPLPTAALTGTQSIYEGQSAKLSVAFTGDAPWTFSVQDSSATGSGAVKSVQTAANPHTLDVSPTQSTAYVLRDVQNGCGLTKLTLTPVLVTVNKVLDVEDQALADALDVYPVPAVTTLTVKLRGLSPVQTARIELISETGLAAWQTETRQETSVLSLDQQPAGVYVLRVRVGDRQASRRIVKR